jgi:hypothetical protein
MLYNEHSSCRNAKGEIMLKKLLLLLSVLIGGVTVGSAQTTSAPLVLVTQGDIWSWREGAADVTRLSTWGYNEQIALNPTGTQVAYHSWAAIVVEAIRREGGFSGGSFPGNIWLIDTANGNGNRVADQPADARFMTPDVPDSGISRSAPVWSPDGTQLAWTEFDYPESSIRVAVHDIATRRTTIIAEGLPQFTGAMPSALNGDWLETGIVFVNYMLNPRTNFFNTALLIYAPDGTPLAELHVPETEERFVMDVVFMRHDNTDVAGILYNNQTENKLEWMLMDLATGELAPITTVEGVASAAPDTSLRLRWQHHPTDAYFTITEYVVLDASGQPINLPLKPGNFIRTAALAPDGRAIAYHEYNPETRVDERELYVWRDGVVTLVPVPSDDSVEEFAWGETMWRVGQ